VVADFVPPGGHETVKMIKEAGGDAIFVEVNVSKSAEVQRMILARWIPTVGSTSCLTMLDPRQVHNDADLAEEAWNSIVATNLTGAFLGSKYAIQVMLKQGGGVIINTASTADSSGCPACRPTPPPRPGSSS